MEEKPKLAGQAYGNGCTCSQAVPVPRLYSAPLQMIWGWTKRLPIK